jgi:hypothetical protein
VNGSLEPAQYRRVAAVVRDKNVLEAFVALRSNCDTCRSPGARRLLEATSTKTQATLRFSHAPIIAQTFGLTRYPNSALLPRALCERPPVVQ